MAKGSSIKQDLKQKEVVFIPMYSASTLMYFISETNTAVSKITKISTLSTDKYGHGNQECIIFKQSLINYCC